MNSGVLGFPQTVQSPSQPSSGASLRGFGQSAVPLRSIADVSNPPTADELTAVFGAVNDGFRIILDDAGAGANLWLIERSGGAWVYAALTKAL